MLPSTRSGSSGSQHASAQADYTQRSGALLSSADADGATQGGAAPSVQCLCFGDIVQLYCEDVGGSGVGGFMGADGFADGQCDIRRILDVGAASKVQDNLYRISAKLQSQAQKKLATQLAKSLENYGKGDNEEEMHYTLDAEEHAAIERFRQEAQSEAGQNTYEQERCRGQVVSYGQTIELRHVKSGKLVTIRSKEVADVESQCQRVCLSEHGGPEAWWMMEPRYRSIIVGEPVRYGDSISITSVKAPGFMLHVAQENTMDAALISEPYEFYEVNCFNIDVKTTWKFHAYTPYAPNLQHLVKGGDVIQLLHVEFNCVLAHSDGPQDVDAGSIYLKPKSHSTALSADSLWRIEHLDPLDGRPCSFGGSCRLRHVVTDQYIALRREASLVSTFETVPATAVQLIGSGAHREGQIAAEQLVYLMGHKSETYLHSQASDRTSGTATASVSHTLQMQDAFRIIQIDQSYLKDCYRAMSTRAALHRFLEVHQQQPEDRGMQSGLQTSGLQTSGFQTRYSLRYAARIITEIAAFASGNVHADLAHAYSGENKVHMSKHQVRRRRQELVRQLALLDDVADTTVLMHKKMKPLLNSEQSIVISTSPRTSPRRADPGSLNSFRVPQGGGSLFVNSPSRGSMHTGRGDGGSLNVHAALRVYGMAHKALQAAMNDCPHNVEHLKDFVPMLLQQMSGGHRTIVDARNTLHTMLACQSTLKETIPLTVIDFFLSGIDTDPGGREEYVHCLAKLLTNKGLGIKRNQDILLHRWLLDKRRSLLIFDTISPEKGIVQIRVRPEPGGSTSKNGAGSSDGASRHQVVGSGGLQSSAATGRGVDSVRIIDLEALTTSVADKDIYALYLAQLEMLQKLCMGCNQQAHALIGGTYHHICPSCVSSFTPSLILYPFFDALPLPPI